MIEKAIRKIKNIVFLFLFSLLVSCVQSTNIERLSAESVYLSIISNGLEAANPYILQDNRSLVEGISCRGACFILPSFGENIDGNIYDCENIDMLNKFVIQIISIDNYHSWLIVKSNILLLINGGVPVQMIQRYANAIPGDGSASILPPIITVISIFPTYEATSTLLMPTNTEEIIPTPTSLVLPTVTNLPVASATPECDPSYPEVCLKTEIGDYDCAGGTGDGPNYINGPIRVLSPDPFELDRDGDGWGCN
jgi:hypothetical protein